MCVCSSAFACSVQLTASDALSETDDNDKSALRGFAFQLAARKLDVNQTQDAPKLRHRNNVLNIRNNATWKYFTPGIEIELSWIRGGTFLLLCCRCKLAKFMRNIVEEPQTSCDFAFMVLADFDSELVALWSYENS